MNPSSCPQPAVTSVTTFWHIPPVFMAMLFIARSLNAGDLTTDNLTVKKTATIWEKVDIQAPTGSAPTNGLILYYALGTNSTTAYDDSGNGITGTVMNGATWVTNGIRSGAFSFDGSNDRIEATPTSTPWVTNQMSVSLWAKYAGTGGTRILFSVSSTLDNTGSKYWIESGGWSDTSIRFAIQQVSTGAGSGVTPTMGEWYHVVGTYDGATLRIYINGNLSGSSALTYNQTTTAVVRVGYDASCSTFNGILDEIRVYNRPLSADEIKGLYYNECVPTNTESTLTVKHGIRQTAATSTNVLMGSVGIGTNTPSTLLDVNGDATIRGTLTVTGDISGSGAGLSGLNATNLASGTIPLARLSGVTSNELAATEREKLDAAQTAAQVNGIVAEVLSTNVAADSAKLGGIAADGFPTLSSNQVWTGVNAFEHEVHLTYGTYLGGASLYAKDGSGYGGGNVYMDGGYLYMSNSSSAYILGSQDAWGQPVVGVGGGNLSLAGRYLYMNGGSGSGGMGIVMDGGYIGMNGGSGDGGGNVYMDGGYLYMSNSSSAYILGSQDAWGQPVVGVGGGNLSLANRYLYMNGGSGSGGMGIVMDGGYIGMNGGNGYGGGNVYMDAGYLYMSNNASAYLYGSNYEATASIKIGNNGCLDLEGSSGIVYHPPLGNLSMGSYTNR